MIFSSSPKGIPPTTGIGEVWKKTILQWKPMEFGGVPEKIDGYVIRNWVSSMYKGIYLYIYHILIYVVPFGE